jgi:hypothetical protein
MSKIITKQIGTKKIGNLQLNTAQIYKEKGHRFTAKDVEQTLQALQTAAKKKGEKVEFLIKGLNGDRQKTLKGYNTDLHANIDEYYQGLDNDELEDFYQLQITVKRYL